MKKLRVFQTVKIRRIVPGAFPKRFGTVLLFFLLIPYFITFLFGNLTEGGGKIIPLTETAGKYDGENIYVSNETAVGRENIPFEQYVADKLARSIDNDFEMEALKAQAVLLRSGLLAAAESEKKIEVKDTNYGSVLIGENIYRAVEETAGIYLAYHEEPVNGSYFAVSNGATRNGEELFLAEYPYLVKVSCDRDFLSPDYGSFAAYDENTFHRFWDQMQELQITEEEILKNEKTVVEEAIEHIKIYRDSAGYALYLAWEGKYVSGEQFREAFELASASFHLSKEEKKIVITVEGVGHGLGMSQYGANEMAKEGEDYRVILNYFFQDVTFRKFE